MSGSSLGLTVFNPRSLLHRLMLVRGWQNLGGGMIVVFSHKTYTLGVPQLT